jgi:hypothetical protein
MASCICVGLRIPRAKVFRVLSNCLTIRLKFDSSGIGQCKTTVILSGFLKITRPTGVVSRAAPTDFGAYGVMRRNRGGGALDGLEFFVADTLGHAHQHDAKLEQDP